MGFRFSNRVSIMPGLKLNLSGHGLSLSAGVRGAHINLGPRGLYGTAGIPGTGLYYRQRLDGTPRTYDRPSVERPFSTRQLEAQQRREEKEEQADMAQAAIDDEWQEYQKMVFFWKPLPEIPSLADFTKAQAKRPFETALAVPPEPDWTREQSEYVERLSASLGSELPYKLLPKFAAKSKANSLVPTLWPAEQAQIQSRYEASLLQYQEQLKTEEGKWDATENERIAWLQRLTAGDPEEVHHTVNEIFAGLCLPIKSHTQCHVFYDSSNLISAHLELPEMDENIPFTRKKLLKSGEAREVTRDKAERNRDYFDLVTGEAAFFAAELFSYLPLCQTIRMAGYTPRPKVKEDDPIDVYILDVSYARDGLKGYDAAKTSMLSFLTHCGARFDLAPDFKLEGIDRPSWLAHTLESKTDE